MKTGLSFATAILFTCFSFMVFGQGDGFLIKDGKRLMPVGSYYMTKDDVSHTCRQVYEQLLIINRHIPYKKI